LDGGYKTKNRGFSMIKNGSFTPYDDVQRMRDESFALRLKYTILVEGKDDKLFWGNVLDRYIASEYKTYTWVNYPTEKSSGKSGLIKHYCPLASKDFLICLDSDYDYLLGKDTLFSGFVLKTYVYSIENYLCYAPSLQNILKTGTEDQLSFFDFQNFSLKFSKIMYPWLLCQLYSMNFDEKLPKELPSMAFSENIQQDLEDYSKKINALIGHQYEKIQLNSNFPPFQQSLNDVGLSPDNAYQFIQGHFLYEKVILKLLKQVAKPIIALKRSSLMQTQRSAYQKYQKTNSFEKLLNKNSDFDNNLFFQKILLDVKAAL
jgi:Protein of unknown function (DUF4435)